MKSSLCDYSDAYILVNGTVVEVGADYVERAADRNNKKATFKNCAPFSDSITKINNTQVDNAKDLDVVMPMYNLIEYRDNYSKTSGSLYQFCRNEPNNVITESESFKFKSKFLDNTNNAGITNAKIAAPLKYLSNSWRTLEMPLINCGVNHILTCVIFEGDRVITFAITDTKLCVPVVTLSVQDNPKLLPQLKSGFKRTINWNKYQSK